MISLHRLYGGLIVVAIAAIAVSAALSFFQAAPGKIDPGKSDPYAGYCYPPNLQPYRMTTHELNLPANCEKAN
jgi:hypothetical protein